MKTVEAAVDNATGTVTWRDYVYVEGRLIVVRLKVGTGNPTWRYATLDTLGSVSILADKSGVAQERLSYNAWGQRRCADGSSGCSGAGASQIDLGFTGHVMFDTLGLIGMGGRVYDPEIGRFLSGDPFVAPYSSQGLNRYSYVSNRPLSAIDPTGYAQRDDGIPIAYPIDPPIVVTACRDCQSVDFPQGIDIVGMRFNGFEPVFYNSQGEEVVVAQARRNRPTRPLNIHLTAGGLSVDDIVNQACSALPPDISVYFSVQAQGKRGNVTLPGAVGVSFDDRGQAVPFVTVPNGPSLSSPYGPGWFVGVGAGGYNGTAGDIRGGFIVGGVTASAARGLSAEGFFGANVSSQKIYGGGLSFGVGNNVSRYGGTTYTFVDQPIPAAMFAPPGNLSPSFQRRFNCTAH